MSKWNGTTPDFKTAATNLCSVYNMDLDCLHYQNELECFKCQAQTLFQNLSKLHHISNFRRNDSMGFVWIISPPPNITICLKILLCLPVTVASGGRSFSKLKLIKNHLRSSMNKEILK